MSFSRIALSPFSVLATLSASIRPFTLSGSFSPLRPNFASNPSLFFREWSAPLDTRKSEVSSRSYETAMWRVWPLAFWALTSAPACTRNFKRLTCPF